MEYKVYGRTYTLRLNESGKIECREPEIYGDTIEEVKAAIRAQADKAKKLPRIKILTFGGSIFGRRSSAATYFEGTIAATHADRYGDHWVAWRDEEGKPQRSKMDKHSFWLDTPENRIKLDQIVVWNKEIDILNSEIDKFRSSLITYEEPE